MRTYIVPKITSKDERWHRRKNYPSTHRAGTIKEKQAVGKRQFDATNRAVRKLPEGHWAATHTERGNVKISREFLNLIPKGKKTITKHELIMHEREELKAHQRRH